MYSWWRRWIKGSFYPTWTLWMTSSDIRKYPTTDRMCPTAHIGDRTCPMYGTEAAPYTWQVLSNEVSAHYRRQCRYYWDIPETIYISLEALATSNQPVKYQSPTAESVSTRVNFRKKVAECTPVSPIIHGPTLGTAFNSVSALSPRKSWKNITYLNICPYMRRWPESVFERL